MDRYALIHTKMPREFVLLQGTGCRWKDNTECLMSSIRAQPWILQDIALAKQHFEYFSVNVFCNNSTSIKKDNELTSWFVQEV